MNGLIAAVLAGGRGERLDHLTAACPKPLVPYAGGCRMVDFSLDNCEASGVRETVLMAKHMAQPLIDYLQQQWAGQLSLNFGHAAPGGRPLIDERGTADALINNRPFLDRDWTSDILVLHSDHIYNFDYSAMLAHHRATGSALTIGYQRIPRRYVSLFGMVEFDQAGNLTAFVEKPPEPTSDCIFTAVAIFRKAELYRYLDQLAQGSWKHDISFDLIPAMLADGEKITGYAFDDYWEDIGTCERYYRAHMRLIDEPGHLRVPATLPGSGSVALRDCAGKSRVIMPQTLTEADFAATRSCLFPGAVIGAGARLENCVVLPGAEIRPGEGVRDLLVSAHGRTMMEPVHG